MHGPLVRVHVHVHVHVHMLIRMHTHMHMQLHMHMRMHMHMDVQEKALLALKPLHAAGLLDDERGGGGGGGECRTRALPAAMRAVLAQCAPPRSTDPEAKGGAGAGEDAQGGLLAGLQDGLQDGLQSRLRPTAEQCGELAPLARQLEVASSEW